MKITIETPKPGAEEEIIVRCASLDEKLLQLIYALKAERAEVIGYKEDKIVKLELKNIYYFESVDNKVFAYLGKEVYEIHKKLYELEQEFENTDFMRISKAVIVNLAKIVYIRPDLNGRFEAKLKNGEKVIISRQYVVQLKKKLGI